MKLPYRSIVMITLLFAAAPIALAESRPNIVWIISEDASPHIGCYGETLIETPHLDRLAQEGVRFTRAYVTSPVCSPSRSALMLGMYPSRFGAHHHRSQRVTGKGGGNTAYYESYKIDNSNYLELIPDLFREAGYYIVNSGKSKTDYNFQPNGGFYDGEDWSTRNDGQPFFAQVQLAGGKNRDANVDNPVPPDDVTLPPYYPDNAVMREDWAAYLNSWKAADDEVGKVLARLEREGELENTAIFFLTDHGISHLRGKQFLYEEGIRIPLIVRLPDGDMAGTVRHDLVSHIDIVHSSLMLAEISRPGWSDTRDLLFNTMGTREYVVSERDRCDETVDFMRSVTTQRFKYIRNFMPHLPHLQPNQYKDGKAITKNARALHARDELPEHAERLLAATRPAEELYDLENDPHELNNLAADPEFADELARMRKRLRGHMSEHGDLGTIPEPILEEGGARKGTKFDSYVGWNARAGIGRVLDLLDHWRDGNLDALVDAVSSEDDASRYWAVTALGTMGETDARGLIEERLTDESPTVRVAAALALGRLGEPEIAAEHLEPLVSHENLLVGMYAIRGLELLGPENYAQASSTIHAAQDSKYEFTRRIARRMAASHKSN